MILSLVAGQLHIGHALNKILKDIINRYKIMTGHRIEYVPGWDCHGLPIEMKALEGLKGDVRAMEPMEVRKKARQHAENTIIDQKAGFMRWGVLGDWEESYKTMDPEYEAAELGVFQKMVQEGYIQRRLKPVYWSPSSHTALAEAELEYPEGHVSRAAYVSLPMVMVGSELPDAANGAEVMIWTTTPWTLPANVAVAFSSDMDYSIADASDGKRYIIATECLESVIEATGLTLNEVANFRGAQLKGSICKHPIEEAMTSLMIPAGHVTSEAGTGLVHTAPGHGVEDFEACMDHDIPMRCPVDGDGAYTDEVGHADLIGLNVLDKETTEAVLAKVGGSGHLVHAYDYGHRYPYDWRTKKPVILRATEQWFVNLASLKTQAKEAIKGVEFLPQIGRARLEAMIGSRNEWCISRQRVWGTPLPAFYRDDGREVLIDDEVISHVKGLVAEHGTDIWWTSPADDLLPLSYRGQGWLPGKDTLDIWLDSGVSWTAALGPRGIKTPVDVYLEGSDQHRGWFQSSLLSSMAMTGKPPYKTIITHGFVLDAKGRKMSKSIGNVVDPNLIVNGGKNTKKHPPYGADILRLWVASTDYTKDAVVGDNILKTLAESYRKVRNSSRFILGNLSDFDYSNHAVAYEDLCSADRYMLHRVSCWEEEITGHYEKYAFSKAYASIMNFVSKDLSAFYFEITKDRCCEALKTYIKLESRNLNLNLNLTLTPFRLYADAENSISRRAAQTVMAHSLLSLTRGVAPICPHLAEDITSHNGTIEGLVEKSVFETGWFQEEPAWRNLDLADDWTQYLSFRAEVNRALEKTRAEKLLPATSAAHLVITTSAAENLERYGLEDLSQLFLTASVEVRKPGEEANVVEGGCLLEHTGVLSHKTGQEEEVKIQVYQTQMKKCARCWRFAIPHECGEDVCSRCEVVLSKKFFSSMTDAI